MKFSGKQLFEMWWGVVGQSVNWNREIDEEQRSHWDALAEKLNAMLEPKRCPYCALPNNHGGWHVGPPYDGDKDAQSVDHVTIVAETPEAAAVIDEWNREHPECNLATHTRSCREKMERGESCSC